VELESVRCNVMGGADITAKADIVYGGALSDGGGGQYPHSDFEVSK
jgi:hypothetical protein